MTTRGKRLLLEIGVQPPNRKKSASEMKVGLPATVKGRGFRRHLTFDSVPEVQGTLPVAPPEGPRLGHEEKCLRWLGLQSGYQNLSLHPKEQQLVTTQELATEDLCNAPSNSDLNNNESDEQRNASSALPNPPENELVNTIPACSCMNTPGKKCPEPPHEPPIRNEVEVDSTSKELAFYVVSGRQDFDPGNKKVATEASFSSEDDIQLCKLLPTVKNKKSKCENSSKPVEKAKLTKTSGTLKIRCQPSTNKDNVVNEGKLKAGGSTAKLSKTSGILKGPYKPDVLKERKLAVNGGKIKEDNKVTGLSQQSGPKDKKDKENNKNKRKIGDKKEKQTKPEMKTATFKSLKEKKPCTKGEYSPIDDLPIALIFKTSIKVACADAPIISDQHKYNDSSVHSVVVPPSSDISTNELVDQNLDRETSSALHDLSESALGNTFSACPSMAKQSQVLRETQTSQNVSRNQSEVGGTEVMGKEDSVIRSEKQQQAKHSKANKENLPVHGKIDEVHTNKAKKILLPGGSLQSSVDPTKITPNKDQNADTVDLELDVTEGQEFGIERTAPSSPGAALDLTFSFTPTVRESRCRKRLPMSLKLPDDVDNSLCVTSLSPTNGFQEPTLSRDKHTFKSPSSTLSLLSRNKNIFKTPSSTSSVSHRSNSQRKKINPQISPASSVNNIAQNLSTEKPSTSQYSFRTRIATKYQESRASDESNIESESSDGEEWILADPNVRTAPKNCKVSEESDVDSDEDSVVGGIISLPKKVTELLRKDTHSGIGKQKKPTKNKKGNQEECMEEEEDIFVDESIETWEEEDLLESVRECSLELPEPEHLEIGDPIEYFELFFSQEVMEQIVQFSNEFSTWKSSGNKCLNLTVEELRKFIGIMLYMGVTQMGAAKDYWHADTYVPNVADIMPLKRFQNIKAALHCYSKAEEFKLNENDRFRKVRFLLEHMRSECKRLYQAGNKFSIDEIIIPYKGTFAGTLKQYMPMKPHSFGFKIFALAGADGIIYDFLPYAGASTFDGIDFSPEEEEMGVGAKTVIYLARSIDTPEEALLFFDNYFSSFKLSKYLKEKFNILSVGTIRRDRMERCPFISDKELEKQGRGAVEYKMKNGIIVMKWKDNKIVHVISTAAGVHPMGSVSRYDKASKTRKDVNIPRAIELYNTNMGGVDLHDMVTELNRCPSRARRWYFPIISYSFDLAVVNGWFLYKKEFAHLTVRDSQPANERKRLQPMSSKDFRIQISKALRGEPKRDPPSSGKRGFKNKIIKNPRGYRPHIDVRHDGIGHFPTYEESQGKCKHCSNTKTRVWCTKCNLNLCFVPNRNCFHAFHHDKAVLV